MVASLVSHLIKQGTYANEDIAILTPYLGQLQKLKKRLAASFEIVVGDRDEEDLEAKGLLPEAENPKGQVQVRKTTLLNELRLATVDNFQGEEAKVIVVSLVRSNKERKCGFLRTSNRINVLLSRARHGMYIVGNADTSRPVPMWAEVLSILESSQKLGPSLELWCVRHEETFIEVSIPDDFSRFAPEGGCALRCSLRLSCGHSCPNMCHAPSLHDAVYCLERCPRIRNGYDHLCPKRCGDICDAKCQVVLANITLSCGHVADQLQCHEAQASENVVCQMQIEKTMTDCEHSVKVRCHELPLDASYPCSAKYGANLSCGHSCGHTCKDCNIRVDGKIIEITHGTCNVLCDRDFTTCSHSCKAVCHGSLPCSLCLQPCQATCQHSKCTKLCHEPCVPCAEDCTWSCTHRGRCPLPCAVPCDLLPCSKRCTETLSCGHRCPSICGEICPSVAYCQTCADVETKEMVIDYILSSTSEEVDLDEQPCIIPSCGHILTLESMDGHMGRSEFYAMDDEGVVTGLKNNAEPFSASGLKGCPMCRGPLRNINRYNRIVRRGLIDEATRKFIVWANAGFVPLAANMKAIEVELRSSQEASEKRPAVSSLMRPRPEVLLLNGSRDHQISRIGALTTGSEQYKTIKILRKIINRFLQQVDEKEQPFGRIYDLVQDARRYRGVNVDLFAHVDILQVRNRLLTTALLLRCDYAILLVFLENQKDKGSIEPHGIQVDLRSNRKDCENLISEYQSKQQLGCTVEGHLYWSRFFALGRSFAEPEPHLSQLLQVAQEHLRVAHDLCDRYPGQTAGMKAEVEDVEKTLRGSTFYMPVTSEEKAAVYAAMALDFRGTGHWYYCENGHPFTIGECGMPMETSQCPLQCQAPVCGRNHQAVDGVRRASDLEREMAGLEL